MSSSESIQTLPLAWVAQILGHESWGLRSVMESPGGPGEAEVTPWPVEGPTMGCRCQDLGIEKHVGFTSL